MKLFRRTLLAAVVAGALVPHASALAQGVNSNSPAKLLLGFSAGGGFDAFTRVLADALSHEMDRTVIVENRPGAGSALAAGVLTRSPADGTVMLVGPDS